MYGTSTRRLVGQLGRWLSTHRDAISLGFLGGFWAAMMFGVVAEYAVMSTVFWVAVSSAAGAAIGAFSDHLVQRRRRVSDV